MMDITDNLLQWFHKKASATHVNVFAGSGIKNEDI